MYGKNKKAWLHATPKDLRNGKNKRNEGPDMKIIEGRIVRLEKLVENISEEMDEMLNNFRKFVEERGNSDLEDIREEIHILKNKYTGLKRSVTNLKKKV